MIIFTSTTSLHYMYMYIFLSVRHRGVYKYYKGYEQKMMLENLHNFRHF